MTLRDREITLIFSLVFSLFSGFPVFAQESKFITTNVKINICGNLVVEKPAEDCEGLDLGGESCGSLGFMSGDLFCDISCEFDTSSCIPFPQPTCGDGTLDAGEECEVGDPLGGACDWSECNQTTCICNDKPDEPERPNEEDDDDEENTDIDKDDLNISPGEAPSYISLLPDSLLKYDLNGDGIIEEEELELAVQLWVNIWRNILYDEDITCDLNNDDECDIYDFSILMYYVGK